MQGKLADLKRELSEMKNNARFMSALYAEERSDRERLEDEAKGYQVLLERQEKYMQIKQRELRDNQEEVNLLRQEVRRLKIEKLGVVEGLTKVLGTILEEKVVLEDTTEARRVVILEKSLSVHLQIMKASGERRNTQEKDFIYQSN